MCFYPRVFVSDTVTFILSLHVWSQLFPCCLCESLIFLLGFSTKSLLRLSLLWFYADASPLFSALSPSQYFLSALFPLLSLSSPVIFPFYLLSNFIPLRRWILFLFLSARSYCPVTCRKKNLFLQRQEQRCERHIDCSGGESKMLWIFTCIHRCDYSGVFLYSLGEDRRSSITVQLGNT